jgi:hypothetical protein
MDYDLTRLNTRSFEQLVQALATAVVGPKLIVYGDGPDGGREATFDGLPARAFHKTWNGYGIIQAKFRQYPDSEPRRNATWVIEQLKAEYERFSPRTNKRTRTQAKGTLRSDPECPEYYVFATNVSLSAAGRTGGKDRVRALLDGYKKSHGLKDYVLWDGDQIRSLLDVHTNVRTSYAAWVLPGDVLSKVVQALDLEEGSFPSTIRRYLESELLDDQLARLGQGGYTDAKNIPLSSVFVDLPLEGKHVDDDDGTGEKAPPLRLLDTFFEESATVLRPSALQQRGGRGQISKASHGRMVVIGGPGQGKTTLSQFACQLLRASLIRGTGGPFSAEVSRALDQVEELSKDLPPISARRYPLRIDLKQFASALTATGDGAVHTLFDYLLRRIAHRTNTTIRAELFRRWLAGYPWALMLDGLDEVPASSNRQEVMQAIRDFVSVEAHNLDADLLVLATTRPQGYAEEFDSAFYTHITLAPLEPERALQYGERLATARHPGQRSRVEELTASLAKATRNPATARLMQSPLQVTIMLALIESGGEPPEQRWKLFRDYYDVIFRREKQRDTPFSSILREHETDLHWVHHRAGWLLQQRNAAAGATDARFTHDEFERLVDERLQKSGYHDAHTRRDLVERIRLAATDRLVLLVGNTEKEIGFEIRSFQEFMAAEHVFDGGEKCVHQTLHLVGPSGYWRNVFLFAAGRIYFERQELIDTVVAVCLEMNEDRNDDRTQRFILSGSRLALALLSDGVARNQPESVRVLTRIAARCLDCRDFEAIQAIATACSGDADEIWKEDLTHRLPSRGEGLPYHHWWLSLKLAEAGKPWANDLMRTRFPWRSPDVVGFIRSMGFAQGHVPDEFWAKLAEHITRHSVRGLHNFYGVPGFPEPLLRHSAALFSVSEVLEQFGEFRWPIDFGSSGPTVTFRTETELMLQRWARWKPIGIDDETAHPEWLLFRAVSEFVRVPTLANLSSQLAAIGGLAALTERRWQLPWQFAVCLQARDDGHPWSEIISGVEAGALGSPEDWARWDEENSRAMPLARCRRRGWHVSDKRQGAIIAQSDWGYRSDGDFDMFMARVTRAFKDWSDFRNLDSIVDACCFGISVTDPSVTNARPGTIAEFVAMCVALQIPLPASAVLAIVLFDMPPGEKARLLATLGSGRIRHESSPGSGYEDHSELSPALATILRQRVSSDNYQHILRAIASLPPSEGFDKIPEEALRRMRAADEESRRAALKLTLARLAWRDDESAELARAALEVGRTYPRSLEMLIEYIESTHRRGSHIETFVLELLGLDTPEVDQGLQSRLASLLVKLVDRRPAVNELPDPQVAIARRSIG